MIPRAVLTLIDRVAVQGRTGPILSACEADDEEEVEILIRPSSGCDQGVVNLAREAIAACLAADLGLPVPKPWIVEILPEIIPMVADAQVADKLRRSCRVAFGSTRTPGFSAWTTGQRLADAMRPMASGVLPPLAAQPHPVDPAPPDLGDKRRAEPVPPEPHRLVADLDAAFMQQVLDIAQRQRKTDIRHHHQSNDIRARLEVAERGTLDHRARLCLRPAALKGFLCIITVPDNWTYVSIDHL